jgi:DNA-binding response OmpR family regulator
MKTKILYADDEPRYLRLVRMFLEYEDFEVLTAPDGAKAMEMLGAHPDVALVILDVLMPVMDGWAVLAAIREFSKVPVLMLTALGDEPHELRGIGAGADDYMAKPFSKDRLVARVRALLRRAAPPENSLLEAGPVALDLASRKVFIEGAPVELTFREFELLRYLMQNKGQVCARERILDAVWGRCYEGDPRTLDTHVKSLRHKLGEASKTIETSRGLGYAFMAAP